MLNHFTFPCDTLCPSQKQAGGKGCRAPYLFSLAQGKQVSHSPALFRGSVCASAPPHPRPAFAHTPGWEADQADPVRSPILCAEG